ncbi:hypothetical protein ESCOCK354M_01855 [Escherichia coli]
MRDDFCAFILTHGRPDKVLTYRTLRRAGYTGKIFIVVDDEDKTRNQYMAEFGEQVLVFSKADNGKYTAQDATTAQKGIIQLSSATNSTSETLAATPKAVKSAYDNAEKRLQKDQNGADIPDIGYCCKRRCTRTYCGYWCSYALGCDWLTWTHHHR